MKYFHNWNKENVLPCPFPCGPHWEYGTQRREALEQRTHLQGWEWLCVLGEGRAARCQVTVSPVQRSVNLGRFPGTEAYKAPK